MREYSPTPHAAPHVQEFQIFYRDNFGLIYRFVYNKVGNREEAEDLTSQIFIKALQGLDRARDPQSTRSWLFQVARTTIVDYWRTRYRMTTSSLEALLEDGWEGPVEDELLAMNNGSADLVQRILVVLPDKYREVLTCRFLLDLSIRETALKMGVLEANAKTLQYRALKRAANLEGIVPDRSNI